MPAPSDHDSPRLGQPHHDGSPRYVPAPAAVARPRLGDRVTVRMEAPHEAAVGSVHVRALIDGEPRFEPARRVARGQAIDVWEARVEVANPTTRYRFLLDGEGGTRWLTQAGTCDHEVPDTWDFALLADDTAPDWVADSVLYQILPDRFARAGASEDWPEWARPAAWHDPVATTHPSTMRQLYGGDLPGIVARLGHLVDLGVTGVCLNPVFPATENHRYCASSFDHVDPFLGGDEALADLAAALHRRGMRLIGDLTINHSGDSHPWFQAAQADANAVEAGFYHWIEHPDRYHGWAGVPTLPKFDHRDPELRRRLYGGPGSVAARWLAAPFDLDGWRVDAASSAGRCGDVDVAADLRRELLATVRAAKADGYVLAEHCHDAAADLQGGGWHGTLDYSGFTRNVWSWLKDDDREVSLLGQPVPLPRRSGPAVARAIDLLRGQVPWRSVVCSLSLLGSHDTSRWAHVAGDRARRHVGIAWLLTFPGVPCIFYGDEFGLPGEDDDRGRLPMPWDDPSLRDPATLEWTRRLVALRRGSVALRRGGMRWVHVDDDVLVFLRAHPRERVLVQLSRGAAPPLRLDARLLGARAAEGLMGEDGLRTPEATLTMPGTRGPTARVWRLAP